MILDVILVLVLVFCAMSGYRRGLLMSLLGLLAVALSLAGAAAAQQTLTPAAQNWLEPRVLEIVEPRIEDLTVQESQDAMDAAEGIGLTLGGKHLSIGDLVSLLREFGLDVEESATQATTDALSPATEKLARDVAHSITVQIAGALVFLAAFVILYLLLRCVALGVNLVDRLPEVRALNHISGCILGLLVALVVATAVVSAVDAMGILPASSGPCVRGLLALRDQLFGI